MKTIKKFLLASMLAIFGVANLSIVSTVNAAGVYDDFLKESTDAKALQTAIDGGVEGGDVVKDKTGAELFNKQVLQIIGYIIDIFIVVGIVVAFIGAYKIMTSDKEDASKEGINLVVFGIVGIIIMVSARFLAEGLVGSDDGGVTGIIREAFASVGGDQPNGIKFASGLYNKIMYPFIKIALYFVVGILFFMTVAKVVTYVTSTDDSVKKKAGGVIIWCVVGILIVMGAKQLVESVMGKQDVVLDDKAQWISDQTPGSVLNFGKIPLVSNIINWVMGLTMLIILVLIIIQGYKMFTKPDDPKNRESLKKTLLYIIIGVLVIGAAYAISMALVINNDVPIAKS